MDWVIIIQCCCSSPRLTTAFFLIFLPVFTFSFNFYLLLSLLPSLMSLSPVPACLRQWAHHPGSCAKWIQTHFCHLHSRADQTEVSNQIGSCHRARDAWLGMYGYVAAFSKKIILLPSCILSHLTWKPFYCFLSVFLNNFWLVSLSHPDTICWLSSPSLSLAGVVERFVLPLQGDPGSSLQTGHLVDHL